MRIPKRAKVSTLVLTAFIFSLFPSIGLAGQQSIDQGGSIAAQTVTSASYDPGSAGASSQNQAVKTITLEQAVALAMNNNPDVLTVLQDVYLREQDVRVANQYSNDITDADSQIRDGEKMLSKVNEMLKNMDPSNPLYAQLMGQKQFIEDSLNSSKQYKINTYENAKVAYFYKQQAAIGLKLTQVGSNVAKQKISLLVSSQYFDVIKYQKLIDVKRSAYNRAKAQADFAKASYEAGLCAKDDYLMANAQAELMKADYDKSIMEYENADLELKNTIGLDQSQKISLQPWHEATYIPNVTKDLPQGLQKRLEIQKANGELEIAKLNFSIASQYYSPEVAEYIKTDVGVTKAEIELKRQQSAVEMDIRQAYKSVMTTNQMKEEVRNSVNEAKESAEIAEYRYKEGLGMPSVVMKALNSEDLAGTMVEVLATQEKLSDIQEKVIEIEYNSNLARANYLIGIASNL